MIDLCEVKENSYIEGDRIIEDLKVIRWVVARGVRVNSYIDGTINTVAKIGPREGIWFSLETKANKCHMLYTDKKYEGNVITVS